MIIYEDSKRNTVFCQFKIPFPELGFLTLQYVSLFLHRHCTLCFSFHCVISMKYMYCKETVKKNKCYENIYNLILWIHSLDVGLASF